MVTRRSLLALLALCLGLASLAGHAAEHQPERITVGYFEQWPTPSLFSRVKQTYDRALGLPVDWVAYDNGAAMNAAMAAGELQIAFSQGHAPFVLGVSSGLELTLLGIAVVYTADDNCMVATDSGITRASASGLQGRKIATVAGGITHFRLLRMLEHLRLDAATLDIQEFADASAAATALRNGEVVMACTYGRSLQALTDIARPLLPAGELEALGLPVFDVISAPRAFVDEHPGLVQTFMDVTAATNAQFYQNPDPMRAAIARAAGMDRAGSDAALERFAFPDVAAQKSAAWLGGRVSSYSRELAEFLVEQGRARAALDDYDRFVSTRFLR